MSEIFKLPASSQEELIKLIQAYASEKEGALLSLDDISHATKIPRTIVSANNGFFVQIGLLITEGNKKATSESGRALGRAYISKLDYEVERIWKEVVAESDFLNRMISAVRIRNGMDRTNLLNHIVYSSGQKDTKQNRTGAGAIIEIFKSISIMEETDGKLTVKEDNQEDNEENVGEIIENIVEDNPSKVQASNSEKKVVSVPIGNTIHININIDCKVSEIDELAAKINNLLNIMGE